MSASVQFGMRKRSMFRSTFQIFNSNPFLFTRHARQVGCASLRYYMSSSAVAFFPGCGDAASLEMSRLVPLLFPKSSAERCRAIIKTTATGFSFHLRSHIPAAAQKSGLKSTPHMHRKHMAAFPPPPLVTSHPVLFQT